MRILTIVMTLLALLGSSVAHAQRSTPAGTRIENQAFLTYVDADGQPGVVLSNLAVTTVQQVYALSVKPDAGNAPSLNTNFELAIDPQNDRFVAPGANVTFNYSLINTGNDTDRIAVSVRQDFGDDFELIDPRVYIDINENGRLDFGDSEIMTPLELSAGQRVPVLVIGRVPSSTNLSAFAKLDLIGRSLGSGNIDNNNLARAVVSNDAILDLSKTAVRTAEDRIRYRIDGVNLGARAMRSVVQGVTLDGAPQDGVLLEDALPAGTVLDLGEAPQGFAGARGTVGIIYYVGASWFSAPSAAASKIGLLIRDANPNDGVSELVLDSGVNLSMSFTVRILSSVAGGSSVTNIALGTFADSRNQTQTSRSNPVVTTLAAQIGVRVGPKSQPVGVSGGQYQLTDPVSKRTWTITRYGNNDLETDGQRIVNIPGGLTVSFLATIRNTGNLPDTFSLSLDNTAGAQVKLFSTDFVTPISSVALAPDTDIDVVVRVTLPDNSPGPNFVLRVTSSAGVGNGASASDTTRFELLPASSSAVWIGPEGRPTATEYPDSADRQAFEVFQGAKLRFKHSVQNGSSFDDTLNLDLETVPPGWNVVWLDLNGATLIDSDNDGRPDLKNLAPFETRDVLLEVRPPLDLRGNNDGMGWNLVVNVSSSLQPSLRNRSLDVVTRIRPPFDAWTLVKTVSPTRTVTPGETLEYALELRNISQIAQTEVIVSDVLSQWLETPSNISNGGAFDLGTRALSWRVARLEPGASVRLTFRARVSPTTPDGTAVPNSAVVQSVEVPAKLESNTTETDVMNAVLKLEKIALNPTTAIGSAAGFELRVRNASLNAALEEVTLTDTLPIGLQYRRNSSSLDDSELPEPDIVVVNGVQVLTWKIGRLKPEQTARLRFLAVVTPNASSDIVNTAIAKARGGSNNRVRLESNTATVRVRVQSGIFGNRGMILGRIFFDRDRDGRFDANKDEPVVKARVYLSNGAYALTDEAGRYSFTELESGLYALRLDPLTVAWNVQNSPNGAATRWVRLDGPSPEQVDFQLLAPETTSQIARDTNLRMGTIELNKSLISAGSGYVVRLELRLDRSVTNVRLRDPIPQTARRQSLSVTGPNGQIVRVQIEADGTLYLGKLEPGTYVIRYSLLTELSPIAALLDPELSWDEVLP